jgi:hypothetical protein
MAPDEILDHSRLNDIAWKIQKTYGVPAVAAEAGLKPSKVSKFCKDQTQVTMRELTLIQKAVEVLEAQA